MQQLFLQPAAAPASSVQRTRSRSARAAVPSRCRRRHTATRRLPPAVAAALPEEPVGGVPTQNTQHTAASADDAAAETRPQQLVVAAHTEPGTEQPLAQQAAPAPAPRWRSMLLSCWRLLQRNLWPLVVVHGVTDALVFLLHRLSHRATNEVAVRLLGGGMLTPAAIGNMWWLNTDPAIANFRTGYQLFTFAFFLLAFPLNVAIKTWASCATILLCRQARQPEGQQAPLPPPPQQQQNQQQAAPPAAAGGAAAASEPELAQWWDVRRGLRQAFSTLKSLNGQVATLWCPVFVVELLVAAVVVPAQFASLAVVTLPLTLPIILELQAAGPVAALEGGRGVAAMKRSRQMLRSLRWQLAVPFVGLVLAGRLLEGAKASLLNSLPSRFYQELVELPLLVLLGGSLLSILIARMQDVLPMVAYWEARHAEALAAAQPGGSQDAGSGASGAVGGSK